MAAPKHTPTPWNYSSGMVWAGRGEEIAVARAARDDEATSPCERDANAEFIVRACNAHDELLEALRSIVVDADRLIAETPRHALSQPYTVLLDQARAAIAKATTETK